MLGSPLTIMVLLEIYSRSSIKHDEENTNMRNASWRSEAANDARADLYTHDLITCTGGAINYDSATYHITDLGRALVQGLCTLQKPKIIYRFNETHEVNI